MISLIKNELVKIFKKKSIYIMLFVILGFVILTNCIYKFFYDGNPYYSVSENYISYLQEELKTLDPEKPSDTSTYIQLKTELDTYELMKQYEENSWQQAIIGTEMATYISEMNTYRYGIEKDEEKLQEVTKIYNEAMEKLKSDDWKYFAVEELKEAENSLKELKEQKEQTVDKEQIKQIEDSIYNKELQIEALNIRLEKDISYAYSFKNTALNNYIANKQTVKECEGNSQELTYEEKKEYYNALAQVSLNQYIIEHNQDIQKIDDLRGILLDFFTQYELFIIVFIIMIAGVIVSEEFSKGTIKLLLVRPYSRAKILLAKYITVMIMIIFVIISVVLIQTLVGGIIFGFDSLKMPAVIYDYNQNQLVTMNAFAYLGVQTLAKIPLYILLATIAFATSAIFTNSGLAIAISLIGYMSSSIINALVVEFNVKFMKYFITMNWDLSNYLFGALPSVDYINFNFSVVICIAYWILMLIPTFIIFKRRNIKNI